MYFHLLVTFYIFVLTFPCFTVRIRSPLHGDPQQMPIIELNCYDLLYDWPKQKGSKILPSLSAEAITEGIDVLKRKYNLAIRTEAESNERLIRKLKNLHTSIKSRNSGGRGLNRYLDHLRGESFEWKIKYEEIERDSILADMNILSDENCRLKKNIKQLEQKLAKALTFQCSLKKQKLRLAKKLVEKSTGRKCKRRKSWQDITTRRKQQVTKSIIADCQTNLEFLGLMGFVATEVKTITESGEEKVFQLFSESEKEFLGLNGGRTECVKDSDIDLLNMTLYCKDKFGIPDLAYQEMTQLFKEMPRFYRVSKRITELNQKWEIYSKDSGKVVYCSPSEVIKERLSIMRGKMTIPKTLRVKLSGDGTRVGKRLNLCVITLSILDEQKANTSSGNNVICLINGEESYEKLQHGLAEIITELDALPSMTFDNRKVTIQYYLGGDYKFILKVLGLEAANSSYPCAWCKVHKDHKHVLTEVSPKRTLADMKACRESKTKSRKYGCVNEPLFPFIPIENVVADSLHLFLRVTDRLLRLLVCQCRFQDGIQQTKVITSKNKHMSELQKLLESNGIFFQWKSDEHGNLQFPDLRGPEKQKLYKIINIKKLLPKFKQATSVQLLWNNFLEITETLRKEDKFNAAEITTLKLKIKKWIERFLKVYRVHDTTPYMHILTHHVGEMVEAHGNLAQFCQQGLERINDIISKMYFRSTNQKVNGLTQIILKTKRIQYFEDEGVPRKKRRYLCSTCGGEGHSCRYHSNDVES